MVFDPLHVFALALTAESFPAGEVEVVDTLGWQSVPPDGSGLIETLAGRGLRLLNPIIIVRLVRLKLSHSRNEAIVRVIEMLLQFFEILFLFVNRLGRSNFARLRSSAWHFLISTLQAYIFKSLVGRILSPGEFIFHELNSDLRIYQRSILDRESRGALQGCDVVSARIALLHRLRLKGGIQSNFCEHE
jgi:hypothetical protein